MLKWLTLEAEQPHFFCPKCLKTGKMSKMSRNGRNVQNVPERAKCPECPKMICYYYAASFGDQLTGNRKHCIFPAGSIARIQELAVLNGQTRAVRFKAQRRIKKTESYNPAGVHSGHPLFTCRHSSMEERRLFKAGHRW